MELNSYKQSKASTVSVMEVYVRVFKVFEGLPNFLRVFHEGFLVFRYKLMRVFREGLVRGSFMRG